MKPILSHALRELGPAALLRFSQYRLGLDSGWIRRQTPLHDWGDRPLSTWLVSQIEDDPVQYATYRASAAPRLFLPEQEALRWRLRDLLDSRSEIAVAAAEEIANGVFPLFGLHRAELGFPPDWHRFAPLLNQSMTPRAPSDQHWSEIDLLELPSDVKLVWELNRFAWVFPLVRAYTLTGDHGYFEIFWELVYSWREVNPPNLGLNWHSGQEVSIRLLALIFAFYAMEAEFHKHPERLASLAQIIAAHAERIPPTLSYAIAQGNNHLLVEAVGLYSVGTLFPEFKAAARWRRIGSRWLIRALRKQVLPDGGYTQHSLNYHRLALQVALWAGRLAETQARPLPSATVQQIARMTSWLEAMVDPQSGAAPNFGPNDGAEILALSMLPFDDHRPTLQAASRLVGDGPLYGAGLWDEWSLWLGVLGEEHEAGERLEKQRERSLEPSGLYSLYGEQSRAFLRASHFGSRPGHADQLHVDIWLGPLNIAMDAGTYLYNADPPWDNALAGAAHHNTALIDESEAMIRAGRFLWLNWNQARLIGRWRSESGDLEVIAAERSADLEGELLHRRTLIRAGDRRWSVVDDLLGAGQHCVDLSWLLQDLPWSLNAGTLHVDTPAGEVRLRVGPQADDQWLVRAGNCVHGDRQAAAVETLGWYSPTYALKIPALQLIHRWQAGLPLRVQSDWFWALQAEPQLELGESEPSADELPLQWVRYEADYLQLTDAYSIDPPSVRRDR